MTIRYKQRKSARWRTRRIAGEEFTRRFLQHVLPKGFHKVRYFGLWHPAKRDLAARVRLMLLLGKPPAPATAATDNATDPTGDHARGVLGSAQPPACPQCRIGHLILIRRLTPQNPMGP